MSHADNKNQELNLAAPDENFVQVLKDNPTLFQRHPELLELVTLADSRGTSSLLEKQVDTLRHRLQNMQSKQSEFIEVVRENEQISDSFVAIICKLIGYQNLSEFAAEFPSALRATFAIDEVTMKTAAAVAKRPSENAAYHAAIERLPNGVAACDNRWPSALLELFFASSVKSAALVPMKFEVDGETIGILALGSMDEERYTHELGTAHLTRLGLMAGICLHRLQLKS